MHRVEVIAEVLRLWGAGASARDIAQRLAVPRSTVRGWLRGDLPRVMSIEPSSSCERCGVPQHEFAALPVAYVYLLGLYLGDGCISAHRRGVHKLRLTLDAAHPGIIAKSEVAIRAVMPTNKVGRVVRGGRFENSRNGSNVEVYCYSRAWPCLFPQHGPGRKHERPIALTNWQSALVDLHPGALLRGLIHSDGCRFVNTGTNWRHPRYSFSNRSSDIRGIFCDACDRLGVAWTTAPHTVYVSRKRDVALLDAFIGPKS